VTPEAVAKQITCGPDINKHIAAVREYLDAGCDEVYVQQIGGNHEKFFRVWADDVLPAVA
jgi:hypothetical protein